MEILINDQPKFESLIEDVKHPNPNINNKAFALMRKYWPEKSLDYFISNLDSNNSEIRRKSVKALSLYEEEIVNPILNLYLSSKKEIVKVSCLKVLVRVAANIHLDSFHDNILEVVDLALKIDSVEIILTSISLLRQLGEISLPKLIDLTSNENILLSKAAMTALGEIDEDKLKLLVKEFSQDSNAENISRDNVLE